MSREPSPEVPVMDMRLLHRDSISKSAPRQSSQMNQRSSSGADQSASRGQSHNIADNEANTPSHCSANRADSLSFLNDASAKHISSHATSMDNASASANGRAAAASTAAANGVAARPSHPRASAASAAVPSPTNGNVHRPSTASATGGSGTSARRASQTHAQPQQPSLPRAATSAGTSAKTASLARPTGPNTVRASVAPSIGASGGVAGAIKAAVMVSTMPEHQFAQYGFDTVKLLKELVRRRDEAVYLRVLPKAQLVQQHLQQEAVARELAVQQEASARLSIAHKALEERAKRQEQQSACLAKERQDELKRIQQEVVTGQRALVAALQAETDKEVRERLRLVQLLQPKLNPTGAALADLKNEQSDCSVLADLLEEDKKLQKALKGDARHAKSKTAETDGGALPHWLKHCAVASYNVAAIVNGVPYRASVLDAPSIASKNAAEKKVLVVRATATPNACILAWAHTRVAKPDVAAAIEALLAALNVNPESANEKVTVSALPEVGRTPECVGVVWPKEDGAAVLKAAKSPKSTCAGLQAITTATLSYGDVASHELAVKDINAIGEAASQ